MVVIWPLRVPTFTSQPVPPSEQMVFVQSVGTLGVSKVRSSSAPEGHVSTHAPQLTQPPSCKVTPRTGPMRVWSPRFHAFHTNWPWTSSQIRTQRKHVTHCDMSTLM